MNLIPGKYQVNKSNEFSKFKSLDEFKKYIEEMEDGAYYSIGLTRNTATPQMAIDNLGDGSLPLGESDTVKEAPSGMGSGSADRFSGTNVQVVGIDEPDILKTDGQQIYFSDNSGGYWLEEPMPIDIMMDSTDSIAPRYVNDVKTNVIGAWPPTDLALSSEIKLAGDLLLADKVLLVFSDRKIVAYDVSNPKQPTEKWTIDLDDDTYLLNSRLYNDKVYLITQTYLNRYNPCPISPLLKSGQVLAIPCGEIYHPNSPIQVDSTFSVVSLDPQSGDIDNKISFVGNQGTANIYMSQNALYVAYTKNLDMFDFMFGFINSELKTLIPGDLLARINKLDDYDISSQSKFSELQTIMNEWMGSLDDDAMLKFENDMQNKAENYYEKNKRSLLSTGIAKININDLKISASGSVPGYLLNQFSMDEYQGNLRVATTIGDIWGWAPSGSDSQANDVYVLDQNLNTIGSVLNLGVGERIYSARFIGDLGYLVTFRQTDPFYVLNLADPKNPKMVGELKIPGYSSYLHPIKENKILGIGMENGNVKLSYFDVADASNPKEISKYSLSEYGSEALYNHHAFLQDEKHQVFFLPSYSGGYIFSYANDQIELVKAVSLPDAKRAVYINDYLYILANDYMAVLDENTWEKVNELDL
ncbi:MAG: hypothetical protein A2406_02170 [Candidatus Komeilibacteria bacterium RIFOXYC1_FULL_37_11]|uniref:Copper amine oxidase-like N-terminal domain-containing protein n=1 Tax=Candidatus Komeilibacteria bacterium RIFOXYC1_FULL_37_11 TaxID=1798555 RepID=A0A1G2C2A2_9BACT|nr:MAG: hypothetical protein A2406_02170 [Candidatus Komeilibacteria bacterium RIFOXYC1_FULL_37_11]OGY95596.1 MAG: hypothetical protein A2611_02455 [Candidatus Komeilibacteria bacterium RIFOXYD1_FULL_37_29]OGY97050.1 MAG: hypothetical protein A2543_01405 [Candidatus Komeilibacteria bacterium RIFOXYD2_FULL_37_8]